MQMGMMLQILPPGVEYGKKADLGAQMLGIGSDGAQGLGRGMEENAIDSPLVLEGDVGDLFRHRKYNVKIGNLEKFGLPVLDPLGARQGLAFGTVTVGTGVIPDALMAAPVTHLDVTAESSGAAQFNRFHHPSLCSR